MVRVSRKKQVQRKRRDRIYIRLGNGERDRYLARWWDDRLAEGANPSGLVKLVLYEALTKTSALTGKPLTVDLTESHARGDDDNEVYDFIEHFDV